MRKKKTVEDMIEQLRFNVDVATTVEQCAIVIQAADRLYGLDFLTQDQANQVKHYAYEKVIYIMEGQNA